MEKRAEERNEVGGAKVEEKEENKRKGRRREMVERKGGEMAERESEEK